ncbi:MAG: hypothetical protein FWE67_06175 [Planctomycetaceae bacterium]|nr:hypothetical protein [Planctomycetaceae bacterium]
MISLSGVSKVFQKLTDTRRKHGVRRPFHFVCCVAFSVSSSTLPRPSAARQERC